MDSICGVNAAQALPTAVKKKSPGGLEPTGWSGVVAENGTPHSCPPLAQQSANHLFFECITWMSAIRPVPWQIRQVSFVPVIAALRGW